MPSINSPGLSPESVAKRMAEAEKALKQMQENPRVSKVVVIVPADACPACQEVFGTYPKDQTPRLPMDACSHPMGCRSFYQPFLDEIYP
jgi:hypothetical protein